MMRWTYSQTMIVEWLMTVNVKVIADSVAPNRVRLTTMQLRYPRFIHAEFMTHRVFSRNASSSRAIPVKKMLQQVWNDPATPVHWGTNRPGMQAREQVRRPEAFKMLWRGASKVACMFAWAMMKLGLHKQVANRILEPWQYISVIVSSTEWDNFFALRNHEDAQPEIRELASHMEAAYNLSNPVHLEWGEWHIPYATSQELIDYHDGEIEHMAIVKASVARCARVSYNNHDGTTPSLKKDIVLHDKLVVAKPLHASPAEHQAFCVRWDEARKYPSSNFRPTWVQYRKLLEE